MICGVIQALLIALIKIRITGGLHDTVPTMYGNLRSATKKYLVIGVRGNSCDFGAFGKGHQTRLGLVVTQGAGVEGLTVVSGVGQGVCDAFCDRDVLVALDPSLDVFGVSDAGGLADEKSQQH